jgi:hypothetical protein
MSFRKNKNYKITKIIFLFKTKCIKKLFLNWFTYANIKKNKIDKKIE